MSDRQRLEVLAHELRSPVAALAALAEAGRGTLDPAQRRRLVELAVAGGRDVERLLSDPDVLSIRSEPVDLGQLLEVLARPGLTVAVTGGLEVAGDPVRLRQALENLVANGLRHGTRVGIEAMAVGETVVIDIVDDGPGVAAGIDIFARGVSGAGSSGYGLWLARSIVERHDGTLELVDDGAPGARFRLVLPSASGEP